jgi:hypothetical protein
MKSKGSAETSFDPKRWGGGIQAFAQISSVKIKHQQSCIKGLLWK